MSDSVAAFIRDAIVASTDARLNGVEVYPQVRGPGLPAITVRIEEQEPLKVFRSSVFGRAKLNLDCVSDLYDRAAEMASGLEKLFSDLSGHVLNIGRVRTCIDGRVDMVDRVVDTSSGGDTEVVFHTIVDIIVRRG